MSHMGLTVSVLVICDLIVMLGFTGCWLLLWG